MSPLLTTRPPIAIVHRLLAACVATAAVAAAVALGNSGGGPPSAASPAFYAAGVICAGLVAYLLMVAARAADDRRLLWPAAGAAIGATGLGLTLASDPGLIAGGGPLDRGAGAGAARYLIWHGGIAVAALLVVMRAHASRRRLSALLGVPAVLFAATIVSAAPFGELLSADGSYAGGVRIAAGVISLTLAGCAIAWWRTGAESPQWAAVCVIAGLLLCAADALAYALASEPYLGAWWASLTLRAGQFAVPAAGLVMGFVAMTDKLRDIQQEVGANLAAELARGRREDALASAGARRRGEIRERIGRLAAGAGLGVAFQPIIDLDTGEIVGVEALARFTAEDGTRIPTESTFLDAHALGLGVELELAAIRIALASQDRLPGGFYLALNVSPALLAGDALTAALAPHVGERALVVELTEHQPVEDYVALGAALDRLRDLGIRVAIDDVGSGFSSFRHITRVNPEILKLDRTLVCGIDADPVRQSLAAAIVAFARDVGATVVSEGIESERELACLRELAVGCGQGFFIARPNLGAIDAQPVLTGA